MIKGTCHILQGVCYVWQNTVNNFQDIPNFRQGKGDSLSLKGPASSPDGKLHLGIRPGFSRL